MVFIPKEIGLAVFTTTKVPLRLVLTCFDPAAPVVGKSPPYLGWHLQRSRRSNKFSSAHSSLPQWKAMDGLKRSFFLGALEMNVL